MEKVRKLSRFCKVARKSKAVGPRCPRVTSEQKCVKTTATNVTHKLITIKPIICLPDIIKNNL